MKKITTARYWAYCQGISYCLIIHIRCVSLLLLFGHILTKKNITRRSNQMHNNVLAPFNKTCCCETSILKKKNKLTCPMNKKKTITDPPTFKSVISAMVLFGVLIPRIRTQIFNHTHMKRNHKLYVLHIRAHTKGLGRHYAMMATTNQMTTKRDKRQWK